jgi:hypothetical protein
MSASIWSGFGALPRVVGAREQLAVLHGESAVLTVVERASEQAQHVQLGVPSHHVHVSQGYGAMAAVADAKSTWVIDLASGAITEHAQVSRSLVSVGECIVALDYAAHALGVFDRNGYTPIRSVAPYATLHGGTEQLALVESAGELVAFDLRTQQPRWTKRTAGHHSVRVEGAHVLVAQRCEGRDGPSTEFTLFAIETGALLHAWRWAGHTWDPTCCGAYVGAVMLHPERPSELRVLHHGDATKTHAAPLTITPGMSTSRRTPAAIALSTGVFANVVLDLQKEGREGFVRIGEGLGRLDEAHLELPEAEWRWPRNHERESSWVSADGRVLLMPSRIERELTILSRGVSQASHAPETSAPWMLGPRRAIHFEPTFARWLPRVRASEAGMKPNGSFAEGMRALATIAERHDENAVFRRQMTHIDLELVLAWAERCDEIAWLEFTAQRYFVLLRKTDDPDFYALDLEADAPRMVRISAQDRGSIHVAHASPQALFRARAEFVKDVFDDDASLCGAMDDFIASLA